MKNNERRYASYRYRSKIAMMHEGDKVMNQEEFIREAWELRNSMLRLAYSIIKEQHEAEDAVQESIVSAWKKLDSLRNEEAFKTWMMRIVINTCRSIQRKRKLDTIFQNVSLPPSLNAPASIDDNPHHPRFESFFIL